MWKGGHYRAVRTGSRFSCIPPRPSVGTSVPIQLETHTSLRYFGEIIAITGGSIRIVLLEWFRWDLIWKFIWSRAHFPALVPLNSLICKGSGKSRKDSYGMAQLVKKTSINAAEEVVVSNEKWHGVRTRFPRISSDFGGSHRRVDCA